MEKTFFIAPGFTLTDGRLVLATPSVSLGSLTINLAAGNGLRIANALDLHNGAEADNNTLRFFLADDGVLDIVVIHATGTHHVILPEPLATALRAELRSC